MERLKQRIVILVSLISLTVSQFAVAQVITDSDLEEESSKVEETLTEKRDASDDLALKIPFAITQYKTNYILPVTYVKDPNTIGVTELDSENVDNLEAKYQISVKLPIHINDDNLSGIYAGFSVTSFWQVYNDEASKPFRETNYEPEIFYFWKTHYRFLGIKFDQVHLGLNHNSNGQSGLKSRSWNRLYASALFSDKDSVYYLKAWYRIPEDEKETVNSPEGDDNPDITDYLGHFEIGYGKKVGNFNFLTLVRNNLKSDNKGSIELNITYPLNKRYDVVFQYFNGYGDSLIDYNRHQQRYGIGIQLKYL
ncbi:MULTISPECIES: phospholipase A [Alteromonadaceae]|uniref:phospholipase A n=1 Tax=Alteromonadaceae TaxID=72275 RepID=UPI001C087B3A|nr:MULTISPECIES: phospholipase A [Aliiglaciecola]MBU2878826.1 phospholipase A [Aliiglaciecola lipolytica]MDO6711276.1 phospholipase A [Aliiglaciecola sp. 2_MG-2023]MDO6752275.1 phospholipase A [Aliiglaciecola sp. 1_MG-2023]